MEAEAHTHTKIAQFCALLSFRCHVRLVKYGLLLEFACQSLQKLNSTKRFARIYSPHFVTKPLCELMLHRVGLFCTQTDKNYDLWFSPVVKVGFFRWRTLKSGVVNKNTNEIP